MHQLAKRASQNPFRKNRGRVVRVAFHPAKPFFFVATQTHVRVYNLARQALAKKLVAGGNVTCLAVHPSGDHVIVGSEARSSPTGLLWVHVCFVILQKPFGQEGGRQRQFYLRSRLQQRRPRHRRQRGAQLHIHQGSSVCHV